MSQHTALEPHIKELGRICLDFTVNIEKKKQSSVKLMTDNHIPRSLRIKCELTTSPSYENNPDYIELKRELNEAVSEFTRKGLHIMKRWSNINITLLTKDRCFNIMKKAIPIMDGLFTYWVEVFQPLPWPTTVKNNPVLFLSKLYFGTDYAEDTEKILQYFELSPAEILLCTSKILTKNNGDTYNTNLLDSIDLDFLECTNENNLIIINETLTAFDNILQAATTLLWEDNQKKSRLAEASQKLNAKLEAERTSSATAATSLAINKAMANMVQNNITNDATQLRISILEKQIQQQNQTSKEILNQLKNKKRSENSHHNYSHHIQHSPFTPENIVDLTSLSPEKYTSPYKNQQKNKKQKLHWDHNISHTYQYNQFNPPNQMFPNAATLNPFRKATSQTPITSHIPFQHIPPPYQTNIPINPFTSLNHQNTKKTQSSEHRDGRYRGGRRGFSRKA